MIHPSYVELMKVVNEGAEIGMEPVVNSRYSIVSATAKRARQIVGGAEPMCRYTPGEKPLSIAVKELYDRDLQILTDEEAGIRKAEVENATRILNERRAELQKENEEKALSEAEEVIADEDDDDDEELVDDEEIIDEEASEDE